MVCGQTPAARARGADDGAAGGAGRGAASHRVGGALQGWPVHQADLLRG